MKKVLAASVVCAVVFSAFIIDPRLPGSRFSVVFKVASIALLVAIAGMAHPRRKLLILALVFSSLGDLVLDVRRIGPFGPVQLFMLGLGAFLVAHLFYFSLFASQRREHADTFRIATCLILVVVALVSLKTIWSSLAQMRVPVVAYSAVLTAMAVSAQVSRFGPTVAIGAVFFFASDTMLAMALFGHPFSGSHILVWVTYYVAQAFITTGAAFSSAERSRLIAMPAFNMH